MTREERYHELLKEHLGRGDSDARDAFIRDEMVAEGYDVEGMERVVYEMTIPSKDRYLQLHESARKLGVDPTQADNEVINIMRQEGYNLADLQGFEPPRPPTPAPTTYPSTGTIMDERQAAQQRMVAKGTHTPTEAAERAAKEIYGT